MKYSAAFLFLLWLVIAGNGQTKLCNLTLKDSPTIRGIKLGMTKQQFAQRIGRSSVGNFVFLYKNDLERLEDFENVAELNALFNSQNILDSFVVKYDEEAVRWADAKEFARNLSNNFKLPLAAWNYFSTENREAVLNCKDFYMSIYSPVNQILIKSLIPEKLPNNRPMVSGERPKRVFKP